MRVEQLGTVAACRDIWQTLDRYEHRSYRVVAERKPDAQRAKQMILGVQENHDTMRTILSEMASESDAGLACNAGDYRARIIALLDVVTTVTVVT